jgi:hypothetical protein
LISFGGAWCVGASLDTPYNCAIPFETDLGPDRAMATFFWLCRGLYMTRISDGFQLPLERDNVFSDFYQVKPKGAPTTGTR